MKRTNCSNEVAVQKAAHSGEWPESLKTHVTACDACREVADTSRWMQALADPSEKSFALQDASFLWWRAQLSEKQTAAVRVQETLEWAEFALVIVVVAGLAVWATWNWQLFQRTVGSLLASLSGSTAISFWSILLVTSLAAIFYPIVVEE